MSYTELVDGTGSSYRAKVDDHGRLWVSAAMVTHEQHHAAYHENLFMVTANVVLPDANETNLLFYKQDNSGEKAEVYRLFCTAPNNTKFTLHFEDSYTSGGTAVTPVNMTNGSGKTLGGIHYMGGSSGDLALNTTHRVDLPSVNVIAYDTREINFGGGMVIKNDRTFSITATGTPGDLVSVSMLLSEHEADYQL